MHSLVTYPEMFAYTTGEAVSSKPNLATPTAARRQEQD